MLSIDLRTGIGHDQDVDCLLDWHARTPGRSRLQGKRQKTYSVVHLACVIRVLTGLSACALLMLFDLSRDKGMCLHSVDYITSCLLYIEYCVRSIFSVILMRSWKRVENMIWWLYLFHTPLMHACISLYIHVFRHTFINTFMTQTCHPHMQMNKNTFCHIYIHTYIHTYIRTYIHTYIYIYTCIYTHSLIMLTT